MSTAGILTSGCLGSKNGPSGEISATFTSEVSGESSIHLRLLDANNETADEFTAEFPAEKSDPTFSQTGFTNGHYMVRIETEQERIRFEWTVSDCHRLDVAVTLTKDEKIEYEGACSNE